MSHRCQATHGEKIVTGASDNQKGEAESGTSLGLLERARARDRAAWERLARLYSPLVDCWCRQAGLQDADAADVRQEVFLAVACGINDFRRDSAGGTFRGWLRGITRHKIGDRWRRARLGQEGAGGSDAYQQFLQLPAEGPDDSPKPSPPEEVDILYRRALDLIATDFEESSWKAFWKVVVEGQRPADVAADLNMTINAVYLAKSRVLARLREEFRDLIEQ
jgi:RNA polymerase sigma-70 factor (ECF subfamily)